MRRVRPPFLPFGIGTFLLSYLLFLYRYAVKRLCSRLFVGGRGTFNPLHPVFVLTRAAYTSLRAKSVQPIKSLYIMKRVERDCCACFKAPGCLRSAIRVRFR